MFIIIIFIIIIYYCGLRIMNIIYASVVYSYKHYIYTYISMLGSDCFWLSGKDGALLGSIEMKN